MAVDRVDIRASNSYYALGTNPNPVVTFPGTPVVGDPIGIWITTNTQTTLMATAPTGWAKIYSIAVGTGSRTFITKNYASADGASVVVPFNVTPNIAVAVVVFNGTTHTGFGTIGTVTSRGVASTTTTAVAAGDTTSPNLVISHEKTTSQTSITYPGDTLVSQLPSTGNAGSIFIGSYDNTVATSTQTVTYGLTANTNGAAYQIPMVLAVVTASGSAATSITAGGSASGLTAGSASVAISNTASATVPGLGGVAALSLASTNSVVLANGAGLAALSLSGGAAVSAYGAGSGAVFISAGGASPLTKWLAKTPWYVAHRGGSLDWVEETYYAYSQSAAWNSMLGLEISVWQSVDGVWVCSHDQSTLRMFGTDYDIPTTSWLSTLSDSFSGYTLGTSYTDGQAIGTSWVDKFGGGGHVSIVAAPDGGQALQTSPAVATSSGSSNAALVTSSASFAGNYAVHAKYRTSAQLRTGSTPNPWEVAWLVWGYQDNSHFYNLVLKPNGWEVDKEVNVSGSQSQVFLASNTTPTFPLNQTYTVDIVTTVASGVPTFAITVNGVFLANVTDTDTTNPHILSGAVGLYSEDSTADWEMVTASGGLSTLTTSSGGYPIAKMTDVLDSFASGSRVIFADNKGQQNTAAFLNVLDGYGGNGRFVSKGFGTSTTMADAATARGYKTWGYYYAADVAVNLPNTQSHWTYLGMDYTAPASAWAAVESYSKPVLGHIIDSQAAATTAFGRGASGIVASAVKEAVPNDNGAGAGSIAISTSASAQAWAHAASTLAIVANTVARANVTGSSLLSVLATASANVVAAGSGAVGISANASTQAFLAGSSELGIEAVSDALAHAVGASQIDIEANGSVSQTVSGLATLTILASALIAGGLTYPRNEGTTNPDAEGTTQPASSGITYPL